jgi:hypothetical protein
MTQVNSWARGDQLPESGPVALDSFFGFYFGLDAGPERLQEVPDLARPRRGFALSLPRRAGAGPAPGSPRKDV